MTIGTLIATLAPSVAILTGGWSVVRALGMVLAILASVALLIASYPDEGQREQAFAIYGVGMVAAALVGPLLMGVSANFLSWRVPFGLETVLVVVALFLTMRAVKETELTMMAFSVGSIILGFASGTLVQRMQPRPLIQLFLLVTGAGIVWLTVTVSPSLTLGQLLLPMFVRSNE